MNVVNSNSLIYIVEPDRKLCDNLMRTLGRSFSDRKVMRFHSNRETIEAIKLRRPCVLLVSCTREEGDHNFESVIAELMKYQLEGNSYPILMGTRVELEHHAQFILDHELLTIAKAIRMPVLVEMIENCFARADLNKISFITLGAGEYLFRQGEKAECLYVLKTGRIAIEISLQGKTKRLKEIGPEEMIGEMAFVEQAPRSASAVALEACELVQLDLGDFREYLDKQSVWVRLIIQTLNQRLREANAQLMK